MNEEMLLIINGLASEMIEAGKRASQDSNPAALDRLTASIDNMASAIVSLSSAELEKPTTGEAA